MENAKFVKRNLLFVLISFVMMFFSCSSVKGYETGEVIPESDYLTFTAEEGNSSIKFKPKSGAVQYSMDNGNTWSEATSGEISLSLNNGESVKFKGNGVTTDYYNHFEITGKVSASGCVDSLRLDSSDTFQGLDDLCYYGMFSECTRLTNAPELSATQLVTKCYMMMFSDCTNLTTTPKLPAINLAPYCYYGMFSGCTSLTKTSDLPAITLEHSCYDGMFKGCVKLAKAPELPATQLADYCYSEMFRDCTDLTIAPTLSAIDLASGCYYEMFRNCKSLINIPEFLATNLAPYCYYYMFSGCTKLTDAYAILKSTENNYYTGMFDGCTNLKLCIFKEHPESFENYTLPSDTITGIILNYENSINDIKALKNSSLGNNILKSNGYCLFIAPDSKKLVCISSDIKEIKNSSWIRNILENDGCCLFTAPDSKNINIQVSNNFIIDSDFVSFFSEEDKSKIKSIEFENSPKEIKNKAFSELNNLKYIIFKNKLSNMTLGDDPFPSLVGSKKVMEMIKKNQS